MKVKISVIFAIHSGGINLKKALDSVKFQSLKDIEVLIGDANCDEATGQMLRSYCSDSRFQYLHFDSDSISEARNQCIEAAQGKYVAFGEKNVIFSKNLLESMFSAAEKENADLCVAHMASSDIYGKHEFTSTRTMSGRKIIDKFDTDLIWNPAVTNKLFLKERIRQSGIRFRGYGKAREAAFSIPFAFGSGVIVTCSKGVVSYVNPVVNEGVSAFPIEDYLEAYEYIISEAKAAFDRAIEESVTDFDRKELKKQMVVYIDQVYHKEITVLLYSYYRHIWSLSDGEIEKYADTVTALVAELSKSGKRSLLKKNKDIFYDGRLLRSRREIADQPKVTVCIHPGAEENGFSEQSLAQQVESVFMQTMPSFELLVDARLKSIFPQKWIHAENITFIQAENTGEFRDLALEKSRTDYIMFQSGIARLNPKILMRHYALLEGRDKYGFTTSPLTRFDGSEVSEYSFSDLSFYSDISQTRIKQEDKAFALDLFFCNKLFRKEHLKGIHFSFSDDCVMDMYKLYSHSRFKKLSHRGAYLPCTEEQAMAYLREKENSLPTKCRNVYRNYKKIYLRRVLFKKYRETVSAFFRGIKAGIAAKIIVILTLFYSRQKLRNQAFFYSARKDGAFLENLDAVYSAYDGEKVAYCRSKPHSLGKIMKIRKNVLRSKVIVTDDYIDCLRSLRLRPEQEVIQVWYTGGAFRRFGLDSPFIGSRLDEYKSHSQYSHVCVSSEYVRQFYAHAFGVDMEVITATGTPRTDQIIRDSKLGEKREEICKKHPLLRNKKVYVYFPTYREIDGSVTEFDPKIDWKKLNDDLDDDEVFVISRHPFMKETYIKGCFYSRVKDYTFDPTAELIAIADVVITDYSSIVFDASLMGKPMVFYAPDYDDYNGEFYLSYEKDLPGEIITDSGDLLAALKRAPQISSAEKIREFRDREMGACDGRATERIIGIIRDSLK